MYEEPIFYLKLLEIYYSHTFVLLESTYPRKKQCTQYTYRHSKDYITCKLVEVRWPIFYLVASLRQILLHGYVTFLTKS